MTNIKQYFEKEINIATALMLDGDLGESWIHLENAHVLSQRYALLHFRSHIAMLRYGIYKKDQKEIFGQIIRLIFAVPSSLLNIAPKGNTGGTNVNMFKSMPVSKELNDIINS